MARFISGMLGVATATLVLSAVHLEVASGNDLDTFRMRYGSATLLAPGSAQQINRESKGDRDVVSAPSKEVLRTVSIQVDQLAHTSVLIRVPVERLGESASPSSQRPVKLDPKASPRRIVACEPVVSALTEVAKLLDSGRCVT